MLTSDEISALISEFRSGHIRSDEKLINFLAIKQLTFDDAIKLLNGLLENNFQEYIGIIYSWLRQNLKILIEKYSPQFTLIMETISKKESEYITGLLLSLRELDLDADSLMNVYRITSNSQNQDLKISSGFILGEIGIVQPKVLIEEFHTIFNQPDELNELAFFKAVLVSSDRYRRTNFILTNDIKSAIIKCTKSSNIRLACLGDVEFELALLYASLNSNIHDEIRLAQRVIETKLLRSSRPLNNNSNIDVLQKFALDYIQELFNRKDMELSLLDEGLLAQIGNAAK